MTRRRAPGQPTGRASVLHCFALFWAVLTIALAAVPAAAEHPHVTVDQLATPVEIGPSGGTVTYMVRVANTIYSDAGRFENLTLESLVDDVHGDLDGRGTCSLPQVLMFVGTDVYTCSYSVDLPGEPETSEANTVTASGFFNAEPSAALGQSTSFVNRSSVPQSSYFSISHRTVTEPDSGETQLEVLISRAPNARGAVVVYTIDGSATHGVDFVGFPNGHQVSFGWGPHASFTLPILGDLEHEGDEQFSIVGLYSSDGDVIGQTTSAATVTVIDNDPEAPLVDDAELVEHTLPSVIDCGTTVSAQLTFENTGTTTWTATTHALAPVGGSDPLLTGAWPMLPSGVEVAPGARHTFTVDLAAPAAVGDHLSDWQMRHAQDGFFGDPVAATVHVGCQLSAIDDAELVDHTLPQQMGCGEQVDAGVTLRNSGTSTWRSDHLYQLRAVDLDDPFGGAVEVALPDGVEIPPGAEHTFALSLLAPSTPGPRTTDWRLSHEASGFGAIAARTVQVICQAEQVDDALLIEHTLPIAMACGETLPVSVTFENTGTSTWREDHAFRLAALGGSDRFASVHPELPQGLEIPPGESYRFDLTFTAPDGAADVLTEWRMEHVAKGAFGDIAGAMTQVTCGDFGVQVVAPRPEPVDDGGVFDLGTVSSHRNARDFEFVVLPPTGSGHSVSNLRVQSLTGPMALDLDQLVGEETVLPEGLILTGAFQLDGGVDPATLDPSSPFEAVLAFDTSAGETYSFTLAGTYEQASSCDVGFDFTVSGSVSDPEPIPADQLPFSVPMLLTVTNTHSSCALEIKPGNVARSTRTIPLGYSIDSDAFDANISIPPRESWDFTVFITAGHFSESATVDGAISVSPSNSGGLDLYDFSVFFDIVGPNISLDNVSVSLAEGSAPVGNGGFLTLPTPVQETRDVFFRVHNDHEATIRIENVRGQVTGDAAAALEWTVDPSFDSIFDLGNSDFGGELEIVDPLASGDFSLDISFTVTDDEPSPQFSEVFVVSINGSLVSCTPECGPLATIFDDRGRGVAGRHSRRLQSDEAIQRLEFTVGNSGDQDLVLTGGISLIGGSARFSRHTLPDGDRPIPPGTTFPDGERFVIGFDTDGASPDEIYETEVVVHGNGTNQPVSFMLAVEPEPPFLLNIEVVNHPIVEGLVDLGTHDQLPLAPLIRVWESGGNPLLESIIVRPSRGGPIEWQWHPVTGPPPEGSGNGIQLTEGEELFYQGIIQQDGMAGNINQPFTFDVEVSAYQIQDGERQDSVIKDFSIIGDLEFVFNPNTPLPIIECFDGSEQDFCGERYCSGFNDLVISNGWQVPACLAAAGGAAAVCIPCKKTGPGALKCWTACMTAILGPIGCAETIRNFDAAWMDLYDQALDCYCQTEQDFCDEQFFIGYDIAGLPLGKWVDVDVSCTTTAPDDTSPPGDGIYTAREVIQVTQANALNYSALRCPENASWVLSASPVRDDDPDDPMGSIDQYRCRLANPTGVTGEQPDIPLTLGRVTEHTMVEIDCHCVGPECEQQITLRGTATGLDADTGPVEVGVHLQGLSINPIVVATVDQDGTFTFDRIVPPVDSYTVSILNRNDAPHCMVASTDVEISEGLSDANVVTLTCDRTVPNVRILTPVDGDEVEPHAATRSVTVRAAAGDESGVARVIFYADGIAVGSDNAHPYEIEWIPAGSGVRTLTAFVVASDGGQAWSEEVEVTVVGGVACAEDQNPPTVFWTPREGQSVPQQMNNSIRLEADATDDTAVVRVEFFFDGQQVVRFGSGPIYTVGLPQTALGDHTLSLKAFDACGNVTEIPEFTFTVTVGTSEPAGGFLDPVNCNRLTGFAADPEHTDPVIVDFFRGEPRGFGEHIATAVADQPCASGEPQCFSIPTPAALRTGAEETVHAQVRDIDTEGLPTGLWPFLVTSPQSMTCPDSGNGPPVPTGLRVEEAGEFNALNLFWDATAGATNFWVYRNTVNHDASATRFSGSVQATSFADTTAEPGTQYFYWVRARNADGTSDFSASASGTLRTRVDEHPLQGTLDVADCSGIRGWARDGDWVGATEVQLYHSGPPGSGVLIAEPLALVPRADLPFPDQNHGFEVPVSTDSIPHGALIHAWADGRDSHAHVTGSFELANSPLAFDCPSSKAPAVPTGLAATDGDFTDKIVVTWNPVHVMDHFALWRHTTNDPQAATQVATHLSATSFEDTSAVPDTTYFYWVRAHSAGMVSDWSGSDAGSRATPPPPPAPAGVVASDGAFADHVRIQWNATAGAEHYAVWRSTGTVPQQSTRIETLITGTHYDDATAVAGTTYTYWVKAHNSHGVSGWSAGDSGFSGPIDDNGPDGNFGTADCSSLIGWARDADSTVPLTVELYRDGPRGTGTLITSLVADNLRTALPYPDQEHGFNWTVPADTIADGTPLYAYAIGVDSFGSATGQRTLLNGSPRSMVCASATAPVTPTGVTATDGAHLDKVRITWSAAARAGHYAVWRSTGTVPQGATRIATQIQGTSYDDTTASSGTTYTYWVKAHNAFGVSDWSGGDAGSRGPIDHATPDGNFGTADCSSLIGWTRDADSTVPLTVEIYRDGPRGTGTLITSLVADNLRTALPYPDKHHGFNWAVPADTIADGTPLYAYAIGVDSAGTSTGQRTLLNGSPRSMVCASATAPATPTGVTATDGAHLDKVRISWSAAARAGHYAVWRSTGTVPQGATRIATQIQGTSYDDTTAASGTTYTYWVKAHNAFGVSDWSGGDAGSRGPVDHATPDGNFGTADCSSLIGWTRDADSTVPLTVELYRDGPRGSGTLVTSLVAGNFRSTLPYPDKHHGFNWAVPADTIADGTPLYAYAIGVDSAGTSTGQRTLLNGSPRSMVCASATAPATPTGVTATDGAHLDKVRISWSAAARAGHYAVWRSTGTVPQGATRIATQIQGTSYDDTTASSGTTYTYWVKAHNAFGVSDWSGGNAGFAGPTNASSPAGNVGGAVCHAINGWTRDADSTVPLTVEIYRDGPRGSGTLIGTMVADELRSGLSFPDQHHGFTWSVTSGAIPHGTPIHVYASDVDSAGSATGQWAQLGSSPRSFDCVASSPPGTPTGVSATDDTFVDKVRITWSAAARAGHYAVWRSTGTVPQQSTRIATQIQGTSFDDTTAVRGTAYTYWVKAHNDFGVSGFSAGDAGSAQGATNTAPPAGSLGTTNCTSIIGWARDPDYTGAIRVRIYRDGDHFTGTLIANILADIPRPGLPYTDKDHGYRFDFASGSIPHGTPIWVRAVGVDSDGVVNGENPYVNNSGRTISCP